MVTRLPVATWININRFPRLGCHRYHSAIQAISFFSIDRIESTMSTKSNLVKVAEMDIKSILIYKRSEIVEAITPKFPEIIKWFETKSQVIHDKEGPKQTKMSMLWNMGHVFKSDTTIAIHDFLTYLELYNAWKDFFACLNAPEIGLEDLYNTYFSIIGAILSGEDKASSDKEYTGCKVLPLDTGLVYSSQGSNWAVNTPIYTHNDYSKENYDNNPSWSKIYTPELQRTNLGKRHPDMINNNSLDMPQKRVVKKRTFGSKQRQAITDVFSSPMADYIINAMPGLLTHSVSSGYGKGTHKVVTTIRHLIARGDPKGVNMILDYVEDTGAWEELYSALRRTGIQEKNKPQVFDESH